MKLRTQTILVITGLTTLAATAAGWGSYALAQREEYRTVDAFLAECSTAIAVLLDGPMGAHRLPPAPPPAAVSESWLQDLPARRPPPSAPPPGAAHLGPSLAGPAPFDPPLPPQAQALVDRTAGSDVVVRIIEDAGTAADDPARGSLVDVINAGSIDASLPTFDVDRGEIDLRDIEIDGVAHRLSVEVLNDGTTINVARSVDDIKATLASLRRQLAVVIVPVILLSAALGWLATRRLSRPLEALSALAEHVAQTGDLDVEFDTEVPGEVGSVARSLRSMLDSLSASRDEQRRLVANAGHELRTPLTALRVNADLLASGRLSAADAEAALSAIGAETRELSVLTGELVELATVAADVEQRVSADLREIADRAAEHARRRHGAAIVTAGSASNMMVQPARIERAIANLLDNAVKFGPADTPITVRVDSNSVAVIDGGAGIDEGDIGRLFERFYRSDVARSLPGSGLGLAIVDKVARDHGGRPFARNHANGVTVGFTLRPSTVRESAASSSRVD